MADSGRGLSALEIPGLKVRAIVGSLGLLLVKMGLTFYPLLSCGTCVHRPCLCSVLQSGTLNSLLTLSETLPKTDNFFTATVSKLLDTLRSLLGDDAAKLEAHTRVNDRPLEEYLFPSGSGGWKWDKRRWGADGKVVEVVEALNKVGPSPPCRPRRSATSYSILASANSDNQLTKSSFLVVAGANVDRQHPEVASPVV